MKLSKRIEVNPKQAAFLQSTAPEKYLVGSRGSGKTFTLGLDIGQCFNYLPRAMFVLANQTYDAVYNITLRGVMQALEYYGVHEYDPHSGYGHYVVGKQPPFGWYKPYGKKSRYENLITFINGYTLEVVSMANPDKIRGNNFDGLRVDEVAFNKKEIISKVLSPTVRANVNKPGMGRLFDHPLHHSRHFFTSAPWTVEAQWIWEKEEEAKMYPEKVFFIESLATDNLRNLPKDYIETLKRELSPMEFYIEVENGRLRKLPNGFYPAFDEGKHVVMKTRDYDYVETVKRIWIDEGRETFQVPGLPLLASFDFNAKFTSCIVCQEVDLLQHREFRILENLYIKPGESHLSMIDALVDKLNLTYQSHKPTNKNIYLYGDRNGNNKSPGAVKTFYEQIRDRLSSYGWTVHLMVSGLDPDHLLKHQLVNELLTEKNPALPIIRINGNKCRSLILSITNAPILPDFRKDKTSETRNVDQAMATHLSDCFDLILFSKYQNLTQPKLESDPIWFGKI
jgi:hypothetical protein